MALRAQRGLGTALRSSCANQTLPNDQVSFRSLQGSPRLTLSTQTVGPNSALFSPLLFTPCCLCLALTLLQSLAQQHPHCLWLPLALPSLPVNPVPRHILESDTQSSGMIPIFLYARTLQAPNDKFWLPCFTLHIQLHSGGQPSKTKTRGFTNPLHAISPQGPPQRVQVDSP